MGGGDTEEWAQWKLEFGKSKGQNAGDLAGGATQLMCLLNAKCDHNYNHNCHIYSPPLLNQ